ncbi:MAG TPA: HAMP domain-containing sensor histidine kinase [Ruminococcus sp.]|nr:HAMP domain-containing sensor histidine kinase [Ruminococcus sp.]
MKSYNRLIVLIVLLIAAVIIAANIFMKPEAAETSRVQNVEISRICSQIEAGDPPDISGCEYVTSVEEYIPGSGRLNTDRNYAVREVGGRFYRFDYEQDTRAQSCRTKRIMNIALLTVAALLMIVLLYIRQRIIRPFHKLSDMPYELSKGNPIAPVKENKNRFFGRFIWGMDMLREVLEDDKRKEIELRKEKHTLLLSLSHDIKTPLAAIKLYGAALSKGLYSDIEKQKEIAGKICKNADDAERFVSDIVKSSDENFLRLEVNNTEFYLSDVIEPVREQYYGQLSLCGTDFSIDKYSNCILCGDPDRCVEVLQNLIGNALKYGDGRSVNISFSDEDGCRLVTVRNSGNSLPEDEIVHIFECFRRGSNSSGKNGSGLGLYICRCLMTDMNGDIFAEIKDGDMLVTAVFRKA